MALLMMITSAICWGSWANTYKGVKNYRFELFYWDYAVGIFLSTLIYGHTLGMLHDDPTNLVQNLHAGGWDNVIWTLIAGAIFNLANLLLVAAIDMAGLAIAFPVSIGIALVVGVVSSYALQPKGNAGLLAAGVICALLAVVLDGKAYGMLSAAGGTNRGLSRKSIVTCVVSGVLMGIWAPFVTKAMTQGHSLGPYAVAIFLTLGALLSCFIWNIYFMKKPLLGEPVGFSGFFSAPASGHLLGLLGGAIWGVGTMFNVVAGKATGFAISYAIGQSAPMIGAIWGVFIWKEFAGASAKAKMYLAGMFAFYCLAILFVAKSNG